MENTRGSAMVLFMAKYQIKLSDKILKLHNVRQNFLTYTLLYLTFSNAQF